MTTVAVLDDKSRFIGLRKLDKKTKAPKDAVVVPDGCDLPTDGSYKWMPDDGCFMPLGHGFAKPKSAPVSDLQVLYILAMSMKNPPPELLRWVQWYEKNLKKAHEELSERFGS